MLHVYAGKGLIHNAQVQRSLKQHCKNIKQWNFVQISCKYVFPGTKALHLDGQIFLALVVLDFHIGGGRNSGQQKRGDVSKGDIAVIEFLCELLHLLGQASGKEDQIRHVLSKAAKHSERAFFVSKKLTRGKRS